MPILNSELYKRFKISEEMQKKVNKFLDKSQFTNTISMFGKSLKANRLTEGQRGLVINGVMYPLFSLGDKKYDLWTALRSKKYKADYKTFLSAIYKYDAVRGFEIYKNVLKTLDDQITEEMATAIFLIGNKYVDELTANGSVDNVNLIGTYGGTSIGRIPKKDINSQMESIEDFVKANLKDSYKLKNIQVGKESKKARKIIKAKKKEEGVEKTEKAEEEELVTPMSLKAKKEKPEELLKEETPKKEKKATTSTIPKRPAKPAEKMQPEKSMEASELLKRAKKAEKGTGKKKRLPAMRDTLFIKEVVRKDDPPEIKRKKKADNARYKKIQDEFMLIREQAEKERQTEMPMELQKKVLEETALKYDKDLKRILKEDPNYIKLYLDRFSELLKPSLKRVEVEEKLERQEPQLKKAKAIKKEEPIKSEEPIKKEEPVKKEKEATAPKKATPPQREKKTTPSQKEKKATPSQREEVANIFYKKFRGRRYRRVQETPKEEPVKKEERAEEEQPPKPAEPLKKMRGKKAKPIEKVTGDDPRIELRERKLDPEKYKDNPNFEIVKGKAIRVTKLKRGEFGYVFRDAIFPVWKVDILASGSNSWSLVSEDMTNTELELFRRMKTLSNDDAISLYFKFMRDFKNIPVEVIIRGLELANNKETKKYVEILVNKLKSEGYDVSDGFNINFKSEGDDSFFASLKSIFKTKLPIAEIREQQSEIEKETFANLQLSKEEIKKIFSNYDLFDRKELDEKLTKIIVPNELKENIEVERQLASEPAEPLERMEEDDEELEVFEVDAMGNIIEERGEQKSRDLAEAMITATQAEEGAVVQQQEDMRDDEIPQREEQAIPPIPPNNNVDNIQMNISEVDKRQKRQAEIDKANMETESKRDELERDNIADISQHGHQIAIQNIFIKENKDFTFIKRQVDKMMKANPNVEMEVDLMYAYYSSLFPLTAPPEYSIENLKELKALEFQYKRNRQFERSWKQSLGNMIQPTGSPSAPMGQNVGIIVNTENMGMTAQQFFQQQQSQGETKEGEAEAEGKQEPPQQPLSNMPKEPTDEEKRSKALKDTTGGVAKGTSAVPLTDLEKKDIIPKPQNIKPKSDKKRKAKVKLQEIKFKVRGKPINPNLLFTNPKTIETPPQPEGDLPTFNLRNKVNNRRKL